MLRDAPQLATTRYFERDFATQVVKLLPGEYFATANAKTMATLLGSCVTVCLYDSGTGVGGMNHFMLPKPLLEGTATRCSLPYSPPCGKGCSARYGECAFRQLLQRLDSLGARRTHLEAKIFGGGRVMAGLTDIGKKNIDFALGYLDERKIPVISSDLGGCCPRKVVFFPATGRVFVKKLHRKPIGIF